MKYYVIFSNKGKFLGYSKDKELVNKLVKSRKKDSLIVHTMKEKEVTPDLKKRLEHGIYDISIYKDERTKEEIVLFVQEEIRAFDELNDRIIAFRSDLDFLILNWKYIKFDDDEKKIVDKMLTTLDTIISEIDYTECHIDYDFYFNVIKYLKQFLY